MCIGLVRIPRLLACVVALAASCGWWRAVQAATEQDAEVAILTGRLYGETATLAAGPVYRLRGTFVVPAGAELRIEPGVTIHAESKSKIVVDGKIVAQGSARRRIVLAPEPSRRPQWHGIVLRGTAGSSLALVEIRDATEALVLEGATGVEITDCEITAKETAIRMTTGSACVIKNTKIGSAKRSIALSGSRLEALSCSIYGGEEGGVDADGSTATIERSVVTAGRGITFRISGESALTVHGCRIQPGRYSVVVDTTAEQDFTGNYWGVFDMPTLRKSGAGANLVTVIDGLDQPGRGRAIVAPFLAQDPRECGANLRAPLSDTTATQASRRRHDPYRPDTRVVYRQDGYLIIDERFSQVLERAIARKDTTEIGNYVRSGVAARITKDTFATIIDNVDSNYHLVILDGPNKGKKGLAHGYDLAESIRLTEADFLGKTFVWSEEEAKDWQSLRLTKVIVFLDNGAVDVKRGFSVNWTWRVTMGGYLVLLSSRGKEKPRVTDQFFKARRENGKLILEGVSTYAHGDGTATLLESPGISE
ncbi:MAG: right-handed parallel beta-helix repeat-containing protein [Verrucomicrobia bacterium]|nr:right-handed parallel beta-helix repeat-containing protein [Verrucomicrobiota bacterium]